MRFSSEIKKSTPQRFNSFANLAIAMLLVTVTATGALAGAESSARALAMGGAHTALAKGVDAGKFNPANLGLVDYRQTSVEFFGVGLIVKNNSFTLDDYNTYSGAILSDADKSDILDKIPTEGLQLLVDGEVSALSMSYGQFALNITGVGVADISLSKDIVDLVFNGNTFADTINLEGSSSDAYSYASVGLSYGRPVYNSGTRQLAVGATFKYLRGIASEHLVRLNGMAATFATGFQGSGEMVAKTASGGTGFAVDLGATLKLNQQYSLGAKLENFVGSITWDKKTEEHGYLFEFDTMTVDNAGDDYVTSEDYTVPTGSYKTSLPTVLTIGFAKTSGKLLWAVDWEQGLQNKPGAATKPLFKVGAEYKLISFLPFRAGFLTGGNLNTAFSFGAGLDLGPFYLDYGMATGGSISGSSAKGANLALSTGLVF